MSFDSETYLALTRRRIKIDAGVIDEKHWKELAALLARSEGPSGRLKPRFDEAKVRLRMDLTPTRTVFVDQRGVAADSSGGCGKSPKGISDAYEN